MLNIKIVMVQTQMPELIGMAMRAMLNFNITNLALVAQKQNNWQEKAMAPSCGAFDKINHNTFQNLEDALADCNIVFGFSARNRYLNKINISLNDLKNYTNNQRIALVFGNEQSGLSNEDVSKCHYLVSIPTNPSFSSLNLAQSIGIACYYLSTYNLVEKNNNATLAPKSDTDYMFNALIEKLEQRNYFSDKQRKPQTIQNLRNIYQKAQLSPQEVKTLIGVHKMLFGKD